MPAEGMDYIDYLVERRSYLANERFSLADIAAERGLDEAAAGVLVAQVILPAGHPLLLAFGGSKGEWFVLGGLGLVVWGYTVGLKRLRSRVRLENSAAKAPSRC